MAWPVRLVARLLRWSAYLVAGLLLIVLLAIVAVQTGWAKNQLRRLIVRQANQYLTATLDIGSLGGSLLRGIELGDIRLSRNGETLVQIDSVNVSYSIRELIDRGTVIRRIHLTQPHFMAAREADGRWNLGALIKRDAQAQQRRGPGRAIHIREIEVENGSVDIRNELHFGAAHVPTKFDDLDILCSFDYEPVTWTLAFTRASWRGREPDLDMRQLTGRISDGPEGWTFESLRVETPATRFTLNGRVDRTRDPVQLALKVDAERFVFQEWSGILTGLKNIAIDAEFETRLDGPLANLATDLNLRSNGGTVRGSFVLDTTAPGWTGDGGVDIERLQLARWLNRPDRPSDITGHVAFKLTDIGLRAGGHFPVGAFMFDGSHVAYLTYEADDLIARGTLTSTRAVIQEATATAYGANVRLTPSFIGIDAPYTFSFVGRADGVDLRAVPKNVPVPHVESTLTFEYDVKGQFNSPFIAGTARFDDSRFLDAVIGPDAVGTIDTSTTPIRYSGEGDISEVDLNHFGEGLDVEWLRDPRYAGTLAGHFHVDGTGTDSATMTLNANGHLATASLFRGELSNADVTLAIKDGSLEAGYSGRIAAVDPSVAFDDPRYEASLTGSGMGHVVVPGLLVRSPELNDYTVVASMTLETSRVSTLELSEGDLGATLKDGTLNIARLHAAGPAADLEASGTLELDGTRSSHIDYSVARGDLLKLRDLIGRDIAGLIVTKGEMTGPADRLQFVGNGTVAQLEASGMKALSAELKYDVSVPPSEPEHSSGSLDGRLSFVEAFGQQITQMSGTASYDNGRVTADIRLDEEQYSGRLAGTALFHPENQMVDLLTLSASLQTSSWRLAQGSAPRIGWDDRGVTVSGLALTDAMTGTQRVAADGTWYPAGGGSLHVVGTHVSLDALGMADGPTRYGGFADVDAILQGTRERPIVTGSITVTEGRVWRVSYQQLKGRLDYSDGAFQIDLRLDQSPGVWLTAAGRLPLGVFYADAEPEQPIDVAIHSSSISLGLLEGLTTVVKDVSGMVTLDVRAVGTTRDPHFDGRVDLNNAGFRVASSGSRYKNGQIALQLATDHVAVETFHLEDTNGDPLDVRGSLATHELRVSDLSIDVNAREFEVLHNEFGRMDVNAHLQLRGQFESPRLQGRITVTRGDLAVDTILDRTMLRPYSVNPTGLPEVDAIAALNPWDRLGLDLDLNVPGNLRLVGDNVQVTSGTPMGLGNINLRALGDLNLYKDPGQQLSVTGSLDSVTGTYSFQGRRFDLDPSSSITFRGDLNPELYVTVSREISGVEARVTIAGALNSPELRLASTPPLEPSDILSLIVFNTSVNQLTAEQQRDLVVRAGALAAGFLAAPMITALERTLGLDTLEIEPAVDVGGGTRVTIGEEIAPGLVARFSRQFGEFDYDEATIEYYLSKILRLRATFSDAGVARSRFRRTERAGVDLLLFFSF